MVFLSKSFSCEDSLNLFLQSSLLLAKYGLDCKVLTESFSVETRYDDSNLLLLCVRSVGLLFEYIVQSRYVLV